MSHYLLLNEEEYQKGAKFQADGSLRHGIPENPDEKKRFFMSCYLQLTGSQDIDLISFEKGRIDFLYNQLQKCHKNNKDRVAQYLYGLGYEDLDQPGKADVDKLFEIVKEDILT